MLLPILKNGKLIGITAVGILVLGIIFQNPVLLITGQLIVVGMVISLFRFGSAIAVIDRRVVRIEATDDGVPDDNQRKIRTTCRDYDIKLVISNPSKVSIAHLSLVPFSAHPLVRWNHDTSTDPTRCTISLQPLATRTLPMTCCCEFTGRFALHGFDLTLRDPYGLVEWRDFLPLAKVFEFVVEEMSPRGLQRTQNFRSKSEVYKHSRTTDESDGDFHQIRQYRWGESVKNVAWKHSLRKGQLLSRDYEIPTERCEVLLLDTSSSMRGGLPVGHKFEYALALAQGHLRANSKMDIATDLILISDQRAQSIGRAERRVDRLKVLSAFALLRSPVEVETIELTESDIIATATEYLRLVERLDFKTHDPTTRLVDPERATRLSQWLEYQLREEYPEPLRRDGTDDAATEISPIIKYLQLKGMSLPYLSEAKRGSKEETLDKIITALCNDSKKITDICVISDLSGIDSATRLRRALMRCRRLGIEVRFLVVPTVEFHQAAHLTVDSNTSNDIYQAVKKIFTESEHKKLQNLSSRLSSYGASVEFLSLEGWRGRPW